jgi:hypothetical protein
MALFPCSICRKNKPGKLATAYWAWFKADGERTARKLRYCLEDAMSELAFVQRYLQETATNGETFACLDCGSALGDDMSRLYVTLYLPNSMPVEVGLPLCEQHSIARRSELTELGEPLPDRGAVMRGPSPLLTAWDAFHVEPLKAS